MTFKPRDWQQYSADQCVALARSGADRALLYACPGSGKTLGGLYTATELIRRVKLTSSLVVITPNLAIKSQWIERAKELGVSLLEVSDVRKLQQSQLPLGATGYILNYQQAIGAKRSLKLFCEEHRPIVILDEVHHSAGTAKDKDGNAWGVAVEWAFHDAKFKICTTGTPFREGNSPIAFVHYNEAGEATANIRYTYEQAIKDGVCRPIEFQYFDGLIAWESRSSGRLVTANFSDALSKKHSRERLEAAVSTDGQFPLRMFAAANDRLMALRAKGGVDATAGGLIVANDTAHAGAIADAMEQITTARPVVVHSKIDDAQDLIARFREGDAPWVVGVSMLSEGVDIPRLRVGVYASRIRAPLYFHQFCGRFARVQESRSERSFVYLPRDPEIEAIAREIEKERYHALGEEPPPRVGKGGAGVGRPRSELTVESSDGAVTALSFGSMFFPQDYVELHQARVSDIRANQSSFHGMPDAELLSILVGLNVIPAPRIEAAA